MLSRAAITLSLLLGMASAASACDANANVNGNYNRVEMNCTTVYRSAEAAMIDGMFGMFIASTGVVPPGRDYHRGPRPVWVSGYCPTYGYGYVACRWQELR